MGIFGFLFGLGCLVVIAWAISLLGDLIFGRKRRQQNRPQEQPSPKPTQFRERFGSPQPPITAPSTPTIPRRKIVALRQPPVSSRVHVKSSRHQQYIQLAALVLEQLRSDDVRLPKALGILRQMNPYAFEELLLTCCHERDWKIKRNFKYSNDGGLDGRVTIAGKLYLIQAKRYRGYIKANHIHDFYQVIQAKKAAGGFFIHTGRTSKLSNQLLQEYRISLLSGQSLVDFVVGQGLKVLR